MGGVRAARSFASLPPSTPAPRMIEMILEFFADEGIL